MFGDFVKAKRLAADLTLREFCRRIDEDASNWSKIERGKMKPPQNPDKLRNIATVLGIAEGSNSWNVFVDYAVIDNGAIPDYIVSEKELLETLPVFFRTINSVKPTAEEIHNLINTLKGEVDGQ